ncbi:MAG: menaquinone biosynthetic enzyme MqnA/MqnD family protein [Syntrophomonadaceae bacterium]|jgi:chorismate dehydratase
MRPRVGHIQFINCFPLFYGLIEKKFLLEIDLIKGYPSDLNLMLKDNLLDMAPVPSISYARNYRDYVLMPDISISCDGEVKSIYLFSRLPIEKLHQQRVAMTNTSATSQALLRILMANHYHIVPEYFNSAPELGAMLMEAEAALLIGDDALRARYKTHDRLFIYDLGLEWKTYTGLPMVFAVWAIRKDYATNHMAELKIVKETFADSIKLSLENIDDVARKASQWEDFGPDYMVKYFQTLKFDFDHSKQEGLLEFYRQAHQLGLLEEMPPLQILDI